MEILRSGGSAEGNGGYIEVRPGGVNKGAFVSAILSRQVLSIVGSVMVLSILFPAFRSFRTRRCIDKTTRYYIILIIVLVSILQYRIKRNWASELCIKVKYCRL